MITATPTIRLLLVDDMPQVREDLTVIFRLMGGEGYELQIAGEAGNGKEALDLFIQIQPEAVLMDLEMPVMDGCAAAVEMKRINPSIRLVALTVHSDASSQERAQRAGFDGFIEKGTPVTEMLQTIYSIVRKEM